MLVLARRSPLENALGFSLGFTKIGETVVWIDGLAAELVQRSLAYFYGYDRRPPTAVRNRRLDLVDFNISVSFGGHETAEVPLHLSGLILRLFSAAWPQNETADRRFHSAVS